MPARLTEAGGYARTAAFALRIAFQRSAAKVSAGYSAAKKRLRTSFQTVMAVGALSCVGLSAYAMATPLPDMAQIKLANTCVHAERDGLKCTPAEKAALSAEQKELGHDGLMVIGGTTAAFFMMCIGFPDPERRKQPKPAPKL